MFLRCPSFVLDTPCEARVDVAQFVEVLSTGAHRNLPVSSPHMNFCNGSTRLPFYFGPFPSKTTPWASWRQWPNHLELPQRYSSALGDYHIQNTLMFDTGKTAVNRWKTDQHLDLERPFRVSIVDGVGWTGSMVWMGDNPCNASPAVDCGIGARINDCSEMFSW